MARNHARVFTSIWSDPDWRKLDVPAQHCYWMLTSHPDLSHCGVLNFVPYRFVDLANGLTETKIRTAVRTLERGRYVVVDRKRQELFVRSFIRHDKILARRNMGNALGRALGTVHSATVREAVMHELARLWSEEPGLEGWAGFKDFDAMAFDMACAMALQLEGDIA